MLGGYISTYMRNRSTMDFKDEPLNPPHKFDSENQKLDQFVTQFD